MSFVRLAPEQHDTIADIPEPAENPYLFGHEVIAEQLARAYRAGKLPHAIVLAGPVGIGKATLAFHLAHHLFSNPEPERAPSHFVGPDSQSQLFRLMAQQAHPSLLHLTRPMNERTKGYKTAITVDEIRRINRFLGMTSHDGGYRVVIVDPADDMNRNAANALLKNLEEPPPRTLFVILAHQPGRLLATIRSRCQVYTLKPLGQETLRAILGHLRIAMPESTAAAEALLERSGGSAREALLMSQFGGADIVKAVTDISQATEFDVAQAWRVAEVVAGRDGEIRFQLFNRAILDAFSLASTDGACQGRVELAASCARAWQEVSAQCSDTEIYNLDRKQHAMSLMRRLHETLRSVAQTLQPAG